MTAPEVMVLCEGMIRRSGKSILEAHGSSTIVICEGHKIVVDTSSAEYRDRVLAGLAKANVKPEDVDMIVRTHEHVDHISNDDLFVNAHVVSLAAGQKEKVLCSGVRLVATPGHTPSSVSVFVQGKQHIAVVGDAIPTKSNYDKWLPPSISFDENVALQSMKLIAEFADVIFPGHEGPFAANR